MDCPRTGCTAQVSLDKFACGRHWRLLPRPVKDRVWARWDGTIALDYDTLVVEANAAWDRTGAP